MPRNNSISVSTIIHIGTVEREAAGSASGVWGVLDFNSSLMVWMSGNGAELGVKAQSHASGTSARRLNKYAASSCASGVGTTS